jgi:RES domain-containing protein
VNSIRGLPETITAWRIGDPGGRYPIWSAEGGRRVQGRWHEAGDAVIYVSAHYSTAMLEKLAHANGIMPSNQHFVAVTLEAGTGYEVVNPDLLPGWHALDGTVARQHGHDWFNQSRSLLLFVPSVVARMEQNIVINTLHPEFARIRVGLETPIWWDQRLFA